MRKNDTPKSLEQKSNEYLFSEMVKKMRPDIFVLMDIIDKNNINVYVIFKFIRHLINISSGTQWGNINVFIKENKVIHIEGIESDHVMENVLKSDTP